MCDDSDHFYDSGEGLCVKCPNAGERVSILFAILIGILSPLICLFIVYKAPPTALPKPLRRLNERLRRISRRIRYALSDTGLQAKVKITIAFYQVLTP